jgi:uncharacterized protein
MRRLGATCAMAAALGLLSMTGATHAHAQREKRPPVIDVHVHSTLLSPDRLPLLDTLNIRYIVLSGLLDDLRAWERVDPARYLPSLVFPCAGGRAPITGRSCFNAGTDLPDTTWLREELRAGRIRGFGEMSPAYLGMSPADARLEPYWRLAEEFDIPVAVHMGFGPPAAAYESSPAPFKSPDFRMAVGDALLLEEVLLKHRRLRLLVMHAGWPRLEPMIALLYAHPGVHVDLAGLHAGLPAAEYQRYMRGLVQAGFADRILFGSDFVYAAGAAIDAVLETDVLTAEQKAAILCGNATRFLRLDPALCDP